MVYYGVLSYTSRPTQVRRDDKQHVICSRQTKLTKYTRRRKCLVLSCCKGFQGLAIKFGASTYTLQSRHWYMNGEVASSFPASHLG